MCNVNTELPLNVGLFPCACCVQFCALKFVYPARVACSSCAVAATTTTTIIIPAQGLK